MDNKEHLYAVIYFENNYDLEYTEFRESNVFDAIDTAFSIVYENSSDLEDYMDELRSNRDDYEENDDIDGYTMWAEDTISSIDDDYSQFLVLIDKSEHKPILGDCDPVFLKQIFLVCKEIGT